LWVPEHPTSAGAEVVDLAGEIGIPLDPEQELALDAMYAQKADGKLAALEFGIVAPRQNIKTHLFKAAAWGDLLLFDQRLVVWTAHEFNTALEAFRDMCELVDGSPLISKRVKKIVDTNGKEGIEFHPTRACPGGQRLKFKARTKGGGRGITGDRVFLDESFALMPSHLGSLLPTMAARSLTGDPQIRYGSSAGLMASAMLRAIRNRGRAGAADRDRGDPGLIYLEWCAPELPCAHDGCDHHFGIDGCVLDDRALWKLANLALGRRIDEEFIAAMRRSLPPEEFAREFLGWWDEPVDLKSGIDLELWVAQKNRKAKLSEPVALAIDVAPNHAAGSIVACGGALHVAAHLPGTSWIPGELVELLARHTVTAVGVDTSGPASALIPVLQKPVAEGGAGLTIHSSKNPTGLLHLMSGRDATSATEMVLSALADGRLVHRDESALNLAVEGAFRRQVGDTSKWSRRYSTVDISPLVAATHAWFLWSQLPKKAPAAPVGEGAVVAPAAGEVDVMSVGF
jgi:hypothetical protein